MNERRPGIAHPVRVAHVVPSLEAGGLENGLVNVIATADASRVRHAVICLERAGDLARRLPPDVPLVVAGKAFGNDPRAFLRAARAARRFRAEIVHTRNWSTLVEGAAAAALSGASLVHGLHGRTHAELGSVPRRRAVLERFLLGSAAERVVVLLRTLSGDAIARGADAARVRVLENGVDLARFRPDVTLRYRMRAELGIPPARVVVGCVARLDAVKDHATLFRAFARVDGDTELVLVGDGPLRNALEQLARVEGLGKRVRFVGNPGDVAPYYTALDVFVLTSLYEGSSNTILEAMASGLPVVATRVGGNPELVTPGSGVLVEAGDASGLGGALKELARDGARRRALGRKGRQIAETRSLERMASAYEDLYLEVARERRERCALRSSTLAVAGSA